jgi:hypothetical protein
VRGVELPLGALDGELTLAPLDGKLGASAIARLPGLAPADLTARFALPERPFDPATWQHRGRDLLKGAAADLDEVTFDPAMLARLGLAGLLARRGLPAPDRGGARRLSWRSAPRQRRPGSRSTCAMCGAGRSPRRSRSTSS